MYHNDDIYIYILNDDRSLYIIFFQGLSFQGPKEDLCGVQVDFVHKKDSPSSLVAVSEAESGKVHILQPESGKSEPLRTLEVHREPCHAIRQEKPFWTACERFREGFLRDF